MRRAYGFHCRRWVIFAVCASAAGLVALPTPVAGQTPAAARPPGSAPATAQSEQLSADSTQPSTSNLPPRLVTLEQKMEALELEGVKISFRQVLSVASIFTKGGHVHKVSSSHGVVEVGFKPQITSRLRGVIANGKRVRGRLVHGVSYLGARSVSRIDGGRPWVRLESPQIRTSLNLGATLLEGGGSFTTLRETLARAISVTEDGTATIAGTQAIQFTATFSVPGHTIEVGTRSQEVPETGKLQLFVTLTGLPIETIGAVNDGLAVTSTVSKLEILDSPPIVKAPPAKLTITERALKRIERRRTNRTLRHMQACLNRADRTKNLKRRHKQVQRCATSGHGTRESAKVVVVK